MKYTYVKDQKTACKVLKRKVLPGQELKDIADAINHLDDNYKPDKTGYRPYFEAPGKRGFAFSHSHDVNWITYTYVGARICFEFRSRETSDYFGKKFLKLHKKHYYS